jgi:hypothetical protein
VTARQLVDICCKWWAEAGRNFQFSVEFGVIGTLDVGEEVVGESGMAERAARLRRSRNWRKVGG